MQGRAGYTDGMDEAGGGMRQGQHEVAVLGLLSQPPLLAHFLLLGLRLQAPVRLVGASWAGHWAMTLLGSVAVQSWEGRRGV